MRCPDCSKFVSMENGDPEINSMEANWNCGSVQITADVRAVRNCADCGTELKECNHTMEEDFDVAEFEGFSVLSKADQVQLLAMIEAEDESVEVEVEEGDGSSDDGGGGRYQKNMITTNVSGTITLTWKREGEEDVVLTKNIDLSASEAASSYDECC